jgi:hypothetical protein
MTSPVAVIGLVWDDFDLQRADLDIHFQISEGLDELPETRGSDEIIPFRRGRLPQDRVADRRPVVAIGWVTGPATEGAAAAYRVYVDALKKRLEPTSAPRILVATMEDGTQRWTTAVPRNLIGGPALGSDFRPFSIEWESLDPYWYGMWGDLTLDGGYELDAGWLLDSSAEVVIGAGAAAEIDTIGSADVTKLRIRFEGPSVGNIGIETVGPVPVGFQIARVLGAFEVIEVDTDAQTVLLGASWDLNVSETGTSVRNLMTLDPGNQHGEYLRLPAGPVTLRVSGFPAETRILFHPTYN